MNPLKRLYVITGKGGVGKSLFSLALTKYLNERGQKVLYNSFDQDTNNKLCLDLNIPTWNCTLEQSAKIYMARKLNSETIAHWIIKTPFFSSLFNMVPGLGYMIYLGHIIDRLKSDPNLIIVMDSPSSGHLLTTFEVPTNFREMFGTGVLVQDINKMESFILDKNILKTIILSLPSKLSLSEGQELKEKLDIKGIHSQVVINDSLSLMEDLNRDNLPDFILKKIQIEEGLIGDTEGIESLKIFQHYSTLDEKKIVQNLTNKMEELL